MFSHLDTLYRQNEQQRTILTEMFAGFGLKPGPANKTQNSEGTALHSLSSGGGSVHRQEAGGTQLTAERQLQAAVRENESLRRENEALKRELDRLRRSAT